GGGRPGNRAGGPVRREARLRRRPRHRPLHLEIPLRAGPRPRSEVVPLSGTGPSPDPVQKQVSKRSRAAPGAARPDAVIGLAAHKIAGAILNGECRPEGLGAGTGPSKSQERFAPMKNKRPNRV